MGRTLTLLDGGQATDAVDAVVYWSSSDVPDGAASLPSLVENEFRELRADFLDWSAGLADVRVGEHTLASHLCGSGLNGTSWWWTTLISERSPMRSPQIYSVLKLRVLERLYTQGGYSCLCYIGSDKKLDRILRRWMSSMRHGYSMQWLGQSRPRLNLQAIFACLPQLVRGILYFGYFLTSRVRHVFPLGAERVKPLADADLAIVSYFPGIDLKAAEQGVFHSHYWGPLHELIRELGLRVNWVWMYSRSSQFTYQESVALRARCNLAQEEKRERYLVIEDFVTFKVLARAIRNYLWLYRRALMLQHISEAFCFDGSRLVFYEFLVEDLKSSMFGKVAMGMCLQEALFHETISNLPDTTRTLLYLWENMGWEQALLAAWKARGQGRVIGVLHAPSVAAYMNFRSFAGSAAEAGNGQDGKLVPDCIVVPGEYTQTTLTEGGWPSGRLLACEAVRFMHLGESPKPMRQLPEFDRTLLVVTGYLPAETEEQLGLLASVAAMGGLARYAYIRIKPHPYCPVNEIMARLAPSFQFTVEQLPVSDLIDRADVVYGANSTSATLEAVYMGMPVIIAGAGDAMNLNPLVGSKGLHYAVTPALLAAQLEAPCRLDTGSRMFNLSPHLTGWRDLLGPAVGSKSRRD